MAHLAKRDLSDSNSAELTKLEWDIQRENEVTAELVAYVDGGCLGNPGPSGIGVVISGLADGPIRIAKWIGHRTIMSRNTLR